MEGNEDIDISLSALVKQQKRFYPAGTYTWTVPEGVTEVEVFLVGGGAGGASATSKYKAGSGSGYTKTYRGSGYVAPSTGTWEGTYEEGRDGNAIPVTPGETVTIVVGKGGAANQNGGVSSFTASAGTYSANGGICGTYGTSQTANKGGNGGSGGGGYKSSGGIDGANGSGTNPGTGQGHTTRDFGEPAGIPNAAGSKGDETETTSRGGYSDGSGFGNPDSGYGGAGAGTDSNTGGGDGTVLIRYLQIAGGQTYTISSNLEGAQFYDTDNNLLGTVSNGELSFSDSRSSIVIGKIEGGLPQTKVDTTTQNIGDAVSRYILNSNKYLSIGNDTSISGRYYTSTHRVSYSLSLTIVNGEIKKTQQQTVKTTTVTTTYAYPTLGTILPDAENVYNYTSNSATTEQTEDKIISEESPISISGMYYPIYCNVVITADNADTVNTNVEITSMSSDFHGFGADASNTNYPTRARCIVTSNGFQICDVTGSISVY